MKTPSTIEALQGAIEMLTRIKAGGSYSMLEYVERLDAYQAARDEHQRLHLIDERNRAAIRNMDRQRRGS